MKLTVRGLSFRPTQAIRRFVEHRLHQALDRHAENIRHVEVVLDDVNGPKGGRDQQCRVRVDLNRGGVLHMTKQGHDVYGNVSALADSLKRAVTRRLDRDRRRRS